MKSEAKTVTPTPAKVADGRIGASGDTIGLANLSDTTTIWYGGADVTVANGYPLYPREKVGFDEKNPAPVGDVWAVVASGAADLRTLRIG